MCKRGSSHVEGFCKVAGMVMIEELGQEIATKHTSLLECPLWEGMSLSSHAIMVSVCPIAGAGADGRLGTPFVVKK